MEGQPYRRQVRRSLWFLRWGQRLFALIGFTALGWYVYASAEGLLYQAYQSRRFEQMERGAQRPSFPRSGTLLGRLEVPRIGLSAMVVEGVDKTSLRRAVGHIPGTAFPGERGNLALAGHRDTFFRNLRDIRRSDLITLRTPAGTYRYQVESVRIAGPRETQLLRDLRRPSLTLVTCYPFSYVGPAPDRFVVLARQVDDRPGVPVSAMVY